VSQDSSFEPARIDWRSLPPERQHALIARIIREARRERDRAVGNALAWCGRLFWRVLKWTALRPAWISYVRRQREQVAAAQLRSMSDQSLADMGVSRGEIDSRVRFRAKPARGRLATDCGGR